eukprot:TRINITY_DN13142_c0_g3_i1.p1 TRINITY_DN13142_c0_g3~~TRINITY_DN13142_c0_g3_i1.p1  ORF type:complete len:948 (+),score=145.94 TRINITY_DN13142_c0_g3_i1:248-3091(+)
MSIKWLSDGFDAGFVGPRDACVAFCDNEHFGEEQERMRESIRPQSETQPWEFDQSQLAKSFAGGRSDTGTKTVQTTTQEFVADLRKTVVATPAVSDLAAQGGLRQQVVVQSGCIPHESGDRRFGCPPHSVSNDVVATAETARPPRQVFANPGLRGTLACLSDTSASPLLIGPAFDTKKKKTKSYLSAFSLEPPQLTTPTSWTAHVKETNLHLDGHLLHLKADDDGLLYALSSQEMCVARQESVGSTRFVDVFRKPIKTDERSLCINHHIEGEFATMGARSLRVWDLVDDKPQTLDMLRGQRSTDVSHHDGHILQAVAWSCHPRVLLAASTQMMHVVDLRNGGKITRLDPSRTAQMGGWPLFVGGLRALEKHPQRERVYAATAANPDQLLLFDTRNLQRPLDRWALPRVPVAPYKENPGYWSLHWGISDRAQHGETAACWLAAPCLGGRHCGLWSLPGHLLLSEPSADLGGNAWPDSVAASGAFVDVGCHLPVDSNLIGCTVASLPKADDRSTNLSVLCLSSCGALTRLWMRCAVATETSQVFGVADNVVGPMESTVPAAAELVKATKELKDESAADDVKVKRAADWLSFHGEQVAVVLELLGLARPAMQGTAGDMSVKTRLAEEHMALGAFWRFLDQEEEEEEALPLQDYGRKLENEAASSTDVLKQLNRGAIAPSEATLTTAGADAHMPLTLVQGECDGRPELEGLRSVLKQLSVELPEGWVLVNSTILGHAEHLDRSLTVRQLARAAAQATEAERPTNGSDCKFPRDVWPVDGVRVLVRALARAGWIHCACERPEARQRLAGDSFFDGCDLDHLEAYAPRFENGRGLPVFGPSRKFSPEAGADSIGADVKAQKEPPQASTQELVLPLQSESQQPPTISALDVAGQIESLLEEDCAAFLCRDAAKPVSRMQSHPAVPRVPLGKRSMPAWKVVTFKAVRPRRNCKRR